MFSKTQVWNWAGADVLRYALKVFFDILKLFDRSEYEKRDNKIYI